jgi:arabinan endo-1,5-alpha-L-arabinosidase
VKTSILKSGLIALFCCLPFFKLFGIEVKGAGRVHDPSTIVYENGRFYFFHTGRGIPAKMSPDLTNWQDLGCVYETSLSWWTNIVAGFKGFIWAPDIARFNGRWHLYYSVSSWGRNRSAIGVAVNKTIDVRGSDYKWVDGGIVIESHRSDNYNAIDPAVFVDEDNRVWLAFGSFWSGIKLIEIDPKTGKRISSDSPIYSLASAPNGEIEAPFIYKRGKYYYLFVNYGLCCRGISSTYNVRVGRSKDIRGPYLDKDGRDMLNGGGSLFLKSDKGEIGPGHIGIFKHQGVEYCSYHFYDPARGGLPSLSIRRIQWDTNDWLIVLKE